MGAGGQDESSFRRQCEAFRTKNKIINFNKIMLYDHTTEAGVHAIDDKQFNNTFRVRKSYGILDVNRTWNAAGHNC